MAALSCRGELFVSIDDFAAIAKAWGRDGEAVAAVSTQPTGK
jgi:hypothetical protein